MSSVNTGDGFSLRDTDVDPSAQDFDDGTTLRDVILTILIITVIVGIGTALYAFSGRAL